MKKRTRSFHTVLFYGLCLSLLAGCGTNNEDEYSLLPASEEAQDDMNGSKIAVAFQSMDYETRTVVDKSLKAGEHKITQRGKRGMNEIFYKVTYVNGEEADRETIKEVTVSDPVEEVVREGYEKTGPDTGYQPGSTSRGGSSSTPVKKSIKKKKPAPTPSKPASSSDPASSEPSESEISSNEALSSGESGGNDTSSVPESNNNGTSSGGESSGTELPPINETSGNDTPSGNESGDPELPPVNETGGNETSTAPGNHETSSSGETGGEAPPAGETSGD